MARTALHSIIIVSVACLLFFTNLGATHLWDEDEGFFAGTATEMFARSDWVVPYFNGRIFAHKPPFMYWMMMLGFEAFGVTPFAARLGSAIFGVGTALVTYLLGRRIFCSAVGLIAAMILCSSLMFDVVARAATPDSYLVFFMTLSLYLFTFCGRGTGRWAAKSDTPLMIAESNARLFPDWKIAVATYAAMAMAVLVKGPIGVLLPMAAIGLYLLCTTPRTAILAGALWYERLLYWLRPFGPVNFLRCLWTMKPLTAVAVVMLIAGPWFICVGWFTRGQFLAEFFGVHNFGRFLHSMESHRGSFLYYPIAILIGFFPWSAFAGPTIVEVVRRIGSRDQWSDASVLIACWILVVVGFFSLAGTKLPNYVLPAYPPLALLTACFLYRWIIHPETVAKWQPRACFSVLGLVGAALLLGLPLAGTLQIQGQPLVAALGATPALAGELPWLGLLGLPLVVGASVSLWFSERCKVQVSIMATVFAAVLFAVGTLGFAAIRIDRYQYMERIANRIIDAGGGKPVRVGHYRHNRPTLVFYLRQPVELIWDPHSLPNFFASNENAFLVTNTKGFADLRADLPADVVVLGEEDQFPKQGKVLLLGRATRMGKRPVNLAR